MAGCFFLPAPFLVYWIDTVFSPGRIMNRAISFITAAALPVLLAASAHAQNTGENLSADRHERITSCEHHRLGLLPPRIDITEVRPTGITGAAVRVRGIIEGVCIRDAGYYERGELVDPFPVTTSTDLKRFEFDVRAYPQKQGAIRAYTVQGQRAEYFVQPVEEADDFRAPPGRPVSDPLSDIPADLFGDNKEPGTK